MELINTFEILLRRIQVRIAQLVADWLGTREVPGSNPGKSENFSVKLVTGLFKFENESIFAKIH